MFSRLVLAAAMVVLPVASVSAAEPQPGKVSVVMDRALPNVPGKNIKGVVVEYAPGGASPAHFHPKSAFIYATVIEGAIRSKVGDAPEKVYKAGENFVEMPGDFHAVSANASSTEPARLLAVFILDSNEQELVRPVKP